MGRFDEELARPAPSLCPFVHSPREALDAIVPCVAASALRCSFDPALPCVRNSTQRCPTLRRKAPFKLRRRLSPTLQLLLRCLGVAASLRYLSVASSPTLPRRCSFPTPPVLLTHAPRAPPSHNLSPLHRHSGHRDCLCYHARGERRVLPVSAITAAVPTPDAHARSAVAGGHHDVSGVHTRPATPRPSPCGKKRAHLEQAGPCQSSLRAWRIALCSTVGALGSGAALGRPLQE